MPTSYITAIGTAVPDYRVSQEEGIQRVAEAMQLNQRQKKVLAWIYRKSNIAYRQSIIKNFSEDNIDNLSLALTASTATRMKLYEYHAKQLAIKAILNGISLAQLKQITHLITVSCTGMYAPGLGIDIIRLLKLPFTIKRSAINFMGCYAAFPALRAASSICQVDPNAKVLIVGIELCTLHLQKEYNEDNLLASAIFSDGAAAVLVESSPTQAINLSLEGFYCNLIPDDNNSMAWYIRDMGFDIRLTAYVPQLLNDGIVKLLDELLNHFNTHKENIDYYAIHPGGKRILQTVENCLEIATDKNKLSHEVLQNYGNMSSVTILFVLQKILHELREKKHIKNILAMAFGPGLTLESSLIGIRRV